MARELVEQRRHEQKEEVFKSYQKVTLDNLFSQIAEGEMKELPIIVKAGCNGLGGGGASIAGENLQR